jgi:hypothetical protein
MSKLTLATTVVTCVACLTAPVGGSARVASPSCGAIFLTKTTHTAALANCSGDGIVMVNPVPPGLTLGAAGPTDERRMAAWTAIENARHDALPASVTKVGGPRGFDWRDAGIGAGVSGVMLALVAAVVLLLTRRSQKERA